MQWHRKLKFHHRKSMEIFLCKCYQVVRTAPYFYQRQKLKRMKVTIEKNSNNLKSLSNKGLEMTKREKLKKVVAVAVAYYLEEEQKSALSLTNGGANRRWVSTRQAMHMRERTMVQQRGRMASTRTLFRRTETAAS